MYRRARFHHTEQRFERFDAPYSSMVHDFAVTEHCLVFPVMPTTSDLARVQSGGAHFAWDGALPS